MYARVYLKKFRGDEVVVSFERRDGVKVWFVHLADVDRIEIRETHP